jgi:peptidoglycan/xylan/chitin deacetylase (PgdA/CDA1 family)
MKRERLARFLRISGGRYLLRRMIPWSGVVCVNYHRVGTPGACGTDRALWSADPHSFEAQLRFLKKEFDVVTPDDLPDILRRRKGRYILITFDDGYRDNYEVAFPILCRTGVPATFFISTGFLDSPRLPWWDEIAWMVTHSKKRSIEGCSRFPASVPFDEPGREAAIRTLVRTYKALPSSDTEAYLDYLAESTGSGRSDPRLAEGLWMSWDMVRQMRAAGTCIGGHTVSHPILATLSRQQQKVEIAGCRQRLEEELGEPMSYFSYPVGHSGTFNADTRDCLREEGVRFAFSFYGGTRRFGDWDDYDIRRLGIDRSVSLDLFRATVSLPQVFCRLPRAPKGRGRPSPTPCASLT